MEWKNNPLIPGAEAAFLVGDSTKAEVLVLRVELPANVRHPPHKHPFTEVATVISGSVGFATGETFDTSKGELLAAGTLAVVHADQSHYIWTEDELTVVQVQFAGPMGITYVNPADDPRGR